MTRFIAILMIGLVLEAVGVTLLSKGLKASGGLDRLSLGAVASYLPKILSQPSFLLGVLFETAFFGILLYLLAQRDVSLVWPLTALGFVITALVARFVLGEEVSLVRWTGIALIVAGAALVSYSEAAKKAGPSTIRGDKVDSTSE